MRLSEYRKELAKIARREMRRGHDPEMASPQWSSATTDVQLPIIKELVSIGDGWLHGLHSSMTDEQKAKAKRYVMVGN